MEDTFREIKKGLEVNKDGVVKVNGEIVKPNYNKPYYVINYNGKMERVHRLVAMAFPEICGELKDGYCVHHRNRNQMDNKAENLICLSPQMHKKLHQDVDGVSIGIVVYKINGDLVGMYSSICDAADDLGVCAAHLNRVVHEKRNTIGGYVAFNEYTPEEAINARLCKIRQNKLIMHKYCNV